eukprot:scaffold12537_cov96-Isochrysis_galbana.AAC.3
MAEVPTNFLPISGARDGIMLPRLASAALGGAAARAVRGALGSAASRLPELVPPVEFASRIDTLPEGSRHRRSSGGSAHHEPRTSTTSPGQRATLSPAALGEEDQPDWAATGIVGRRFDADRP